MLSLVRSAPVLSSQDAQAQDGVRARQPANGPRARLSDILVTSGLCMRRCEICAPAEQAAWEKNCCCLRPLSLIGPCHPPPPQSGGRASVCGREESAWSEISEARPHQPTTQLKCVLGQTQPVNPFTAANPGGRQSTHSSPLPHSCPSPPFWFWLWLRLCSWA